MRPIAAARTHTVGWTYPRGRSDFILGEYDTSVLSQSRLRLEVSLPRSPTPIKERTTEISAFEIRLMGSHNVVLVALLKCGHVFGKKAFFTLHADEGHT